MEENMTDEEIDTMKAGSELDALIAEQFFGRRFGYYSGRIDYAWQVVEKMESLGHWCQTQTPFGAIGSLAAYDGYWAGFTPHGTTGWNGTPDHWTCAETLPLAICLAALKATTPTP